MGLPPVPAFPYPRWRPRLRWAPNAAEGLASKGRQARHIRSPVRQPREASPRRPRPKSQIGDRPPLAPAASAATIPVDAGRRTGAGRNSHRPGQLSRRDRGCQPGLLSQGLRVHRRHHAPALRLEAEAQILYLGSGGRARGRPVPAMPRGVRILAAACPHRLPSPSLRKAGAGQPRPGSPGATDFDRRHVPVPPADWRPPRLATEWSGRLVRKHPWAGIEPEKARTRGQEGEMRYLSPSSGICEPIPRPPIAAFSS